MPTLLQLEQFMRAHSDIKIATLKIIQNTQSVDIKRHLHRGLLVRLSMIESALIELEGTLANNHRPLDPFTTGKLALFLNSYYINISGAMDNLAWALLHKHNIFTPINEDTQEHRKTATLTSQRLANHLTDRGLNRLAQALNYNHKWMFELKKFRDPSAHRIPLIVPPTVLSESDITLHKSLDQEATQLMSSGQHKAGMEKFRASYSLGQFVPIFICENPSISPYHVGNQINDDHSSWLEVVNCVIYHGFSQD